jgi:lipid-binding SYLF domain-containing protein
MRQFLTVLGTNSSHGSAIVRKALLGFSFLVIALLTASLRADPYADTIDLFKNAGQSGTFFKNSYGYAVFPTIGKGAFVVGGAHGKGQVYERGKYVGDTAITKISVGFQAGGEAYSQMVFFQDKRAFDEFTSGNFEFGADVSAVVITAAVSGEATTSGSSASASGGKKDATTVGAYHKGMAVFTIVKGGAMAGASVAGQKFSYTPRAKA